MRRWVAIAFALAAPVALCSPCDFTDDEALSLWELTAAHRLHQFNEADIPFDPMVPPADDAPDLKAHRFRGTFGATAKGTCGITHTKPPYRLGIVEAGVEVSDRSKVLEYDASLRAAPALTHVAPMWLSASALQHGRSDARVVVRGAGSVNASWVTAVRHLAPFHVRRSAHARKMTAHARATIPASAPRLYCGVDLDVSSFAASSTEPLEDTVRRLVANDGTRKRIVETIADTISKLPVTVDGVLLRMTATSDAHRRALPVSLSAAKAAVASTSLDVDQVREDRLSAAEGMVQLLQGLRDRGREKLLMELTQRRDQGVSIDAAGAAFTASSPFEAAVEVSDRTDPAVVDALSAVAALVVVTPSTAPLPGDVLLSDDEPASSAQKQRFSFADAASPPLLAADYMARRVDAVVTTVATPPQVAFAVPLQSSPVVASFVDENTAKSPKAVFEQSTLQWAPDSKWHLLRTTAVGRDGAASHTGGTSSFIAVTPATLLHRLQTAAAVGASVALSGFGGALPMTVATLHDSHDHAASTDAVLRDVGGDERAPLFAAPQLSPPSSTATDEARAAKTAAAAAEAQCGARNEAPESPPNEDSDVPKEEPKGELEEELNGDLEEDRDNGDTETDGDF